MVDCASLLDFLDVAFAGPSSTTTKDFCRSRSFHFSVREMELNQSVDWLSAQTVGNGYFDAVTLMWSPSVEGAIVSSRKGQR